MCGYYDGELEWYVELCMYIDGWIDKIDTKIYITKSIHIYAHGYQCLFILDYNVAALLHNAMDEMI